MVSKENKRIGVYQYENGDKFEGEWLNDNKRNKGVFYYKNGNIYEGDMKGGVKNGRGSLVIERNR